MSTLFATNDAISSKEGKAFINVEGVNEELFYATKVEAKVEKTKAEVKSVGRRMHGSKTVGMKGTGTLSIHSVTSMFNEMVAVYQRTGVDFYFNMTIIVEDKTSTAGNQTLMLFNCNLDSVVLASFDATDDGVVTQEIPFTFDAFELLSRHTFSEAGTLAVIASQAL